MASKTDFTDTEWGKLFSSSNDCRLSDHSRRSGLDLEYSQGKHGRRWALLEAGQNAQANSLVRAVAEDFTTPEGRASAQEGLTAPFAGKTIEAYKSTALTELRAVKAILNAKAPNDADAFASWLQVVAQKTAEAATEGGFLGLEALLSVKWKKPLGRDCSGSCRSQEILKQNFSN